jgi:hypothetical protein
MAKHCEWRLSNDWNHMNHRKTQKSCRDLPGSLESPRDGLHKKKRFEGSKRWKTMENHWIYGHSILKQNQIFIFRFFSCVSSTFAGEYIRHGFAVNFPVTERHFSGGLSLKSHSNALVDIRAPCMTFVLPKRVHGLFDIKWCPSHCPSHSTPAFSPIQAHIKTIMCFVFSYFLQENGWRQNPGNLKISWFRNHGGSSHGS